MFEVIIGFVVCIAVAHLIVDWLGWLDYLEKDEWE